MKKNNVCLSQSEEKKDAEQFCGFIGLIGRPKVGKYTLLSKLVGEKISKNTEPQAVESGTLIIKTKNSAWRQELIFKQSEILESINKKLGKNTIKAIRFI